MGVAYVGTLCEMSQGYNTGANKWQAPTSWFVYAHELGHNFDGKHSFEEGQGRTGGVMDYGDGKLNGHYQFNTKYRKTKMCAKMNAKVNKCYGMFQKDKAGGGGGNQNGNSGNKGSAGACGFESGSDNFCNFWKQSKGDNADWIRRSGTTPSGGTGPSKAAEGKSYLFLEASKP